VDRGNLRQRHGCRRVTVDTPSGNLELHGGTAQAIQYRVVKYVQARNEAEARRKFAAAPLQAVCRGNMAEISLESEQHRNRRDVGAHFVLNVPKSLAYAKLGTAGGNVFSENIDGEAMAKRRRRRTSDQIGGTARLETAGGLHHDWNGSGKCEGV